MYYEEVGNEYIKKLKDTLRGGTLWAEWMPLLSPNPNSYVSKDERKIRIQI
jgi:hypothetical protein